MEFPIKTIATERQFTEFEYIRANNVKFNNLRGIIEFSYSPVPYIDNVFINLVRKHESLRTSFSYENNKLYQIIHSEDSIPSPENYVNIIENRENVSLDKLFKTELEKGFDYSTWPLFRILITQIEHEKYLLAFLIDHIISDGKSLEILKSEITDMCDKLKSKLPIVYEPQSFQMKDHALWEEKFNSSELGVKNLKYWKKEFEWLEENTLDDLIPFKIRRDKNLIKEPTGCLDIFLTNTMLENVKTVYKNINLFILSVIIYWLLKISKKRNIIVAMPFSSRETSELEHVVGYLISALYIHVDLRINQVNTFEELMLLVGRKYSNALDHRNYSRRKSVSVDPYSAAMINNLTYRFFDHDYKESTKSHSLHYSACFYPFKFSFVYFKNGRLIICDYDRKRFPENFILNNFTEFVNSFHDLPDNRFAPLDL
ncbi:condensation domain-containing protein [Mucilaginibacter sp. P25]|uniref:condensation domain-containing protein n=1 Tax=Mucilaginibacter sp. P25 TaxID=3423945 RepID=UPI003D79F0B5